MNNIEKNKYKGFKLISLDLKGNSLISKNHLFYSFIDDNDEQNNIYTTVIIGPNGTGKSNLFRIIIELLKELNDLAKGKNRSYNVDGNFHLKFSVNGNIYEYSNISAEVELSKVAEGSEKGNIAFLLCNGIKVDFNNAQLPLAIVANSIMLTDKFPFYRKENNEKGEKVDAFP